MQYYLKKCKRLKFCQPKGLDLSAFSTPNIPNALKTRQQQLQTARLPPPMTQISYILITLCTLTSNKRSHLEKKQVRKLLLNVKPSCKEQRKEQNDSNVEQAINSWNGKKAKTIKKDQQLLAFHYSDGSFS